KYPLEKFQNIG
nr:RecName: Full=Elongation factor G; Short=EF-G; AltName: Full=CP 5 [Clostridium pasteurianum]